MIYTADVPEGATKLTYASRIDRFNKILGQDVVDLEGLRELAWTGIPPKLRPRVWRLLLGYEPAAQSRQTEVLGRRREEYSEMRSFLYDMDLSLRSEEEQGLLKQIQLDVPRTAPGVPFFHIE